ncbi:phosphoglycerate mutase 1-like [Daktulosphaira vitifoliae]|uniref:phosphoglycerate mutase 1-like n=1 Tax=Daktulosphaira vitifoliae TaxID=58002 RepID=UPI0021AA34E5|nr:phosphoglycerate mutase 1-like [Daktulosphaira vitifoliae]XP_050530196.1 phosphoglycerate mutase 1-like [Daktulosphaira vitifoliae]XP_050530198.1 phosphoglycerate mutase 1-like [Daktulosphaira vitifoliae]
MFLKKFSTNIFTNNGKNFNGLLYHIKNIHCAAYNDGCTNFTMYKLVMIRHGESEWNKKNLFCGWYDAALSCKGKEEAKKAGRTLYDNQYKFDLAYTSMLNRAQETLEIILKEINQTHIPVCKSWHLNERHYGSLTGLNKVETAKKFGEKKVQEWRRSFDKLPPEMKSDHAYYKQIINDSRYSEELCKNEFPLTESLKLTIERVLPYWKNVIVPQIKLGKRVIIAAHGNSLRGLIKHLDCISNDGIMNLNLPTGIPFLYELDENLKPLISMKFLGDAETIKKATEAIANQGKIK